MTTLSISDLDAIVWALLTGDLVTDEDRAAACATYAHHTGRPGLTDD